MASTDSREVDRRRLFASVCLTLVPSGASFALISNIVLQLKEQFVLTNYQVGLITGAAIWGSALCLLVMGSLLEAYGLKNGFRLGFLAHFTGVTMMISAIGMVGNPAAFWLLMVGAATLSVGNGMMITAGDPLVVALYPGEKTLRLNWYHAFFPVGIMLGGLTGFVLTNWGGPLRYWPFQLAVIYLPVLAYGALVLPKEFPKTENAQAGLPVREMFRYTFTRPLFLLLLVMMGIGTSMELGSMRWVPPVLQAAGIHGILVLVWISGLMMTLRLSAGHFVKRFSPSGMLVLASSAMGLGLYLLTFATGTWSALAAASVFAFGPAFFFPTMVGSVSERMPRTGSLGIVLTAGVGLGSAGAIGVPVMGDIADRYLVEALEPAAAVALLEEVEARFPGHLEAGGVAGEGTGAADAGIADGEGAGGADGVAAGVPGVAEGAVPEVAMREALALAGAALAAYRSSGAITGDATPNALRAVVRIRYPPEQELVARARATLLPAEAYGGRMAFRRFAPLAFVLVAVFGTMYLADLRKGGYRAVRLERAGEPVEGVTPPV